MIWVRRVLNKYIRIWGNLQQIWSVFAAICSNWGTSQLRSPSNFVRHTKLPLYTNFHALFRFCSSHSIWRAISGDYCEKWKSTRLVTETEMQNAKRNENRFSSFIKEKTFNECITAKHASIFFQRQTSWWSLLYQAHVKFQVRYPKEKWLRRIWPNEVCCLFLICEWTNEIG